jgi:hypothetical protein
MQCDRWEFFCRANWNPPKQICEGKDASAGAVAILDPVCTTKTSLRIELVAKTDKKAPTGKIKTAIKKRQALW